VVLVLGLAGYFTFIRTSHLDRGLLGALLIHRTPVHVLRAKPTMASSVSPSTSTFAVVKKAGKRDPSRTGIYEIEWASSNKSALEAGMLFQLLPDPSEARTTLADSEKEFGKTPQLTGQTLAAKGTFSIAGVPGSTARTFAMTGSSSGAADGYAYTVLYRYDRSVVTELVESSSTKVSTSAASSIAQAEEALLRRAEPGFSMEHTTTPLVASLVFAAVALAVAAGAYFVPEWAVGALERRHERREEKERERARSEYRARGRRTVSRHKAAAWRRPPGRH